MKRSARWSTPQMNEVLFLTLTTGTGLLSLVNIGGTGWTLLNTLKQPMRQHDQSFRYDDGILSTMS